MNVKMQIRMPANAYFFFLRSIPCEEELLQPRHTIDNDNAAGEYIAARDIWCSRHWTEMDFDGLILSAQIRQLVYPVFRRRTLLRWEHDNVLEWFVRGPVEHFWAVQEDTEVTLSLVSGGSAMDRLREELLQAPRGTMTTLCVTGGQTVTASLDGLSPDDEALADAMERQMRLYYWEEENA